MLFNMKGQCQNSNTVPHNRTEFIYILKILYSTTMYNMLYYGKGKAVPLKAWTGPEGSRKLRFPDFVTTAQDGGS